jgi:CHAT domain-containing protein
LFVDSEVFLETEQKDSVEDGMLHAFELYQMSLDAQLVVLSACNSGTGKISNGEGILSLAYGFMYAGVPSIVASHWTVDDASSYLIMEKFYKNLNDGMDKGAALRKAKLEALQELPANKTFPMYWGGYYLIGDTNPIDIESNRMSKFLLFSIVGFVAFILLTIYIVKIISKAKKIN